MFILLSSYFSDINIYDSKLVMYLKILLLNILIFSLDNYNETQIKDVAIYSKCG